MNEASVRRMFARLLRRTSQVGVLLCAGFATRSTSAQGLPDPGASGIEHIVVVTMENRSFDHLLGWLPHADGRQEGLVYTDASGIPHETFRLAPDYQGCAHPDPDHTYAGGRVEFDGGSCDGWLRAGSNDVFSIGYYKRNDLAFLGVAARQWTVCDRYFAAIMSETWPNRIYEYCAQTDRLDGSLAFSSLPTIWDELIAAGVSARYYFSDVPFVALWGLTYLPISRPFATFLADAAAGSLPAVAYVDPRFVDEQSGTSGDDHPHADIRNGEAFLDQVYRAVTTSPDWPHTVLVITFDEWGGFFDHVPPPLRPIPPSDQALGDDGRLGFRVPCIVVSPFAAAQISHVELDHTSILRMIEWRWSLPALTVRDATANNLADVLDFTQNRLEARQFSVPTGPFGGPCPGTSSGGDVWSDLLALALGLGWQL
jgi:phospholipase C